MFTVLVCPSKTNVLNIVLKGMLVLLMYNLEVYNHPNLTSSIHCPCGIALTFTEHHALVSIWFRHSHWKYYLCSHPKSITITNQMLPFRYYYYYYNRYYCLWCYMSYHWYIPLTLDTAIRQYGQAQGTIGSRVSSAASTKYWYCNKESSSSTEPEHA